MSTDPNSLNNCEIIREFYRKTKLIHKNQIKTIWEATHIYSGDVVIIKIQALNDSSNDRNILHEGKFVQSCQGSPGIPFMFWCGKDQMRKQAVLIEEKLGKTLKHITAEFQNHVLSLKSTVMIGIQLIKAIACYHEKGYIHRNINLDTIQFGVGARCDKVYFNDFIESRPFYKKGTLQHIDKKTGIKLKKANEFTSFDVLTGVEPSRKDDLESIIMILIFLLKGSLPWSNLWQSSSVANQSGDKSNGLKGLHYSQKKEYIKLKSEEKLKMVAEIEKDKSKQTIQKQTTFYNGINGNTNAFSIQPFESQLSEQSKNLFRQLQNPANLKSLKLDKRVEKTLRIMELFEPNQVCHGLPRQICEILTDVKALEFNSKPNYPRYIQKLNAILIKNDLQNDSVFDWMNYKTVSQSTVKGGLSIKHLEWLIKGQNGKSKLVEFDNEAEILAIYDKLAPFIEIDKLVTY